MVGWYGWRADGLCLRLRVHVGGDWHRRLLRWEDGGI